MADSGEYDQATLQRRYAMAQALMDQGKEPIKHWAQGLSNVANSALGGYEMSKLDDERRGEKAAGRSELFAALGLPAPATAAPEPSQGGFQKIAALLSGGGSGVPVASPAALVAPPDAAPISAPQAAPVAPQAAPIRMASAGPVPEVLPARAPVEPMGDIVRTNPDGSIAGNTTAPTIPTSGSKIAAALTPANAGILADVPSEKRAQIAAMLASNNPTVKALGVSAVSNLTKQDTPINVGGKLVTPQGKVVYDGGDTTPAFGVIGEDAMGRKQYGFADKDKKTVTPVNPQASNAPPDNLADLHGPEYMAAIKAQDPKLANQVQAIIEGRAPYPTGMLLKTPYGQQLAAHVTQSDPSFESGNATSRVKTRNEFMTGGVGSPAGQITAGNTALQHAGEMSDALERMKEGGGVMRGLGNAGIPMVSYAANQLKNKSVQGTPEGAALNDFMTAKNHFSEEVTKFYAGSAGSEAERTRALANLDAAKSLPELRSAIKTEVNLMQGKVNALQDRWKNGMGPLVPEFPLIQPKSQEAIDRVIQRHQSSEQPSSPASAAPQTATNPQTGEKLILQNGQWVPVK